MRILFVQTNTYELLSPFPLGASLVASALERRGHDVRFVDLMRERDPAGVAARAAHESAPDLACFSIRNRDNMSLVGYLDPLPQIRAVMDAVRSAASVPTLVGGTAFTTYPARLLERLDATWGLAGDDLAPIGRFVDSVAAGAPDLATPGLVYRDGAGEIRENPFRLVGYDGVRFDHRHVELGRYARGYWQAGVVTRSGCPEGCIFCDTFHTFGRTFQLRDPDLVADELLALKRTGRVHSVFLVDAGFNRPLDHAKKVLRAILRTGAQLSLYAIHDPGDADDEYFDLFRRAGGLMVVFFAESLADTVLAALAKPFDRDDIERDAARARRAGVAFLFMPTFGSPGETPETVEETLRRLPRLGAAMTDFSIGWRIQPRTALRDLAVREGVLAPDDDCFEPRFYVSPATPRPFLEKRLAAYRWRHPLRALGMLPMIWRAVTDRPWTRGPEATH